jgi:hypothetical protein
LFNKVGGASKLKTPMEGILKTFIDHKKKMNIFSNLISLSGQKEKLDFKGIKYSN